MKIKKKGILDSFRLVPNIYNSRKNNHIRDAKINLNTENVLNKCNIMYFNLKASCTF